jgi:hypothetical protein
MFSACDSDRGMQVGNQWSVRLDGRKEGEKLDKDPIHKIKRNLNEYVIFKKLRRKKQYFY